MPRVRRLVAVSRWGAAAAALAAAATAAGVPVGLSEPTAILPTAIVVGVVVSAAKLLRDAARNAAKHAARHEERTEAALAEIAAISAFSMTEARYPLPLGGRWALAWDGAVILAREVALAEPETIVELGAGASSLVIGLQLRRANRGRVLSLEHDPQYATITRRHVAALGLEPWVEVLDAPLEDVEIGGRTWRWYRVPPEVEAIERLDMLVVDGPPQWVDRDGEPRYPALPVLGPKMHPGSTIFLDDADRGAEARMIERWLAEQPQWIRESLKTRRGTAILRWPAAGPAAAADPATARGDPARV